MGSMNQHSLEDLNSLTLRIHTEVADKEVTAIKLWYFCRALSDNGRATFNIKEVAQFFEVTTRTIQNWINGGIRHNYFRFIQHDGKGNYVAYYSALIKVSLFWGTTSEVNLTDLKNLKVIATEIEAQHCQSKAMHAAKSQYKEQKKVNPFLRRVQAPEKYFLSTPSVLKALGVLGQTERYLLVDHNFNIAAASHRYIGELFGRSESTIKRRLKNTQKIQLAQHKNEYYAEKELAQEEWKPTPYFYAKSNKHSKNLLFKASANVYYPQYHLFSMRSRVKEVKAMLGLL